MKMHMFRATIEVVHGDEPLRFNLIKGHLAETDHMARRLVLSEMLDKGYHVRKLEPFVLAKPLEDEYGI